MRTTGRILAATAVMGSSLLLAAPASAQTATTPVCAYPFDCPVTPGTPVTPVVPVTPLNPVAPIGGGSGGPGTGETPDQGTVGGGDTDAGDTDGGASTIVDNSPAQGSAGAAASLPFTGGEVTLIALAGLAALGGGVALLAVGRKRAQV